MYKYFLNILKIYFITKLELLSIICLLVNIITIIDSYLNFIQLSKSS